MLDDHNLSIPGYSLIQAGHPDDVKRGGFCLYFKETLTLKVIDNSFITQCIVCEIRLQNQKGYVVVIYRSPSQSSTEFEEFSSNFDKLLNHIKHSRPSFTIILGNFNAKSKSWWSGDVTSHEGTQIESLTTMHSLQQLISDPTHLLPNSSSCIDLIFTDQPNLAVNSGVHPSLHVKCHHQIIHCKFNLMIVYPPPYERLVWDYKRANTDAIISSINQVDWEFLFFNKNVHQQVYIFNKTLISSQILFQINMSPLTIRILLG